MKKVLGHSCEGLEEHFDYADYRCIPRLTEDGRIEACEDENSVVINFCPYCGVEL